MGHPQVLHRYIYLYISFSASNIISRKFSKNSFNDTLPSTLLPQPPTLSPKKISKNSFIDTLPSTLLPPPPTLSPDSSPNSSIDTFPSTLLPQPPILSPK